MWPKNRRFRPHEPYLPKFSIFTHAIPFSYRIHYFTKFVYVYRILVYCKSRDVLLRQINLYTFNVALLNTQVVGRLILTMVTLLARLHLRRPRPIAAALIKQPGMVACVGIGFERVWVTGWLPCIIGGPLQFETQPAIAVGSTCGACLGLLGAQPKLESRDKRDRSARTRDWGHSNRRRLDDPRAIRHLKSG